MNKERLYDKINIGLAVFVMVGLTVSIILYEMGIL